VPKRSGIRAAKAGRHLRRVLVLHGPNLNLLGEREPTVYGRLTLGEIDRELSARATAVGAEVECFQSNVEGELVGRIQGARGRFDAIVINAAAYSHTSVAIRDALQAVAVPAVEVHLSNVHRRAEAESYRAPLLTAAACIGTIAGFGPQSYYLGLEAALQIVKENS
jgi:3-dehydroquinate dehydratase-2